jgi:hypothetical protein
MSEAHPPGLWRHVLRPLPMSALCWSPGSARGGNPVLCVVVWKGHSREVVESATQNIWNILLLLVMVMTMAVAYINGPMCRLSFAAVTHQTVG